MSDKVRMGLIVVGLVLAGALLLYLQGEPDEVTVPAEVSTRGTETVAKRQPVPQPETPALSPEPAARM